MMHTSEHLFRFFVFFVPPSGHVFVFYFETMSNLEKSSENSIECADTL